MIKKILYKYKLRKIKNQIISDLFLLCPIYLIFLLLVAGSEIIFYHSTILREKIFILLSALLITLIIYIILKIVIHVKNINSNMSDESLAKELGEKVPNLSDRILNALQLSKTTFENKIQDELSQIAIKQIDADIKKESFKNIIEKLSIYRVLFLTLTLSITFSSFLIFEELGDGINRIYNYNSNFEAPTPFSLVINKQESKDTLLSKNTYPSGSDIHVSFSTKQGEQGPDNITLYWIDVNQLKDSLILPSQNGKNYDHTFLNVKNTIQYWGYYKSKEFFSAWDTVGTKIDKISIVKRPEIQEIQFELIYPEYTNLKTEKFNQKNKLIEAIEGSRLSCKIKVDQNLSSALIRKDSATTVSNFKKVDDNYWETSLLINEEGTQRIIIQNLNKLENESNLEYRIRLKEDFIPDYEGLSPEDKTFEINNETIIPIKFKIHDDYGLDKSWIEYNIIKPAYMDIDSTIYTLPLNNYFNALSYQETYNWELLKYNLFPGDQIQYRLAIKDNNPNNNGIRKTDYYYAIYPSFEDIFSALQEKEHDIQEASYDIINQINEVEDIVENMKLDLLKASKIDWQQQQQAEESIKKMEDIFTNIEEMQEAINQLQNEAEKGNVIDNDLIDKFDQFQELLESIMTPELMEALQKMQEALANMDLEKMLEATENFDYNLEQFEQQLDRFIEMFELAIAEQKINELVNALKLMTEEQKNIKDNLNENNNTKQLSAMQHRQNQKFDDLQNTMKETSESTKKFSEETAKAIDNLIKSDLNNDTQEMLDSAQKKLSKGDSSASNDVESSEKKLQEMHEEAQDIQALFQEESTKEMIAIFYTVIRNILKLSEYQENLNLNFKGIRFSSPKVKEHAFNQFTISKQFTKFIEQLMILSTKTFYITPDINSKIGFCKKTLDGTVINLEQRQVKTAINQQGDILASMNEIALLLINAMNEMQNTGSASGLSSYMEQLENISQGQSELNMGTMQLGQMGMMGQQEMMARLKSQQKALQEQLKEILDNLPGENPGGLSKAEEEMREVLEDFQNNRVTKETQEKQQKILSKLLDSQKSLKEEQELSNKRKGTIVDKTEYSGPLDIPDNLGENKLLFIDTMEEALKQNYSQEYEKIFRNYYRELHDAESK